MSNESIIVDGRKCKRIKLAEYYDKEEQNYYDENGNFLGHN